jgi:peptide chain release factor subunit 1
MQQFLSHLGKDTGRAIYGEPEIRNCLEQGAVAVLLLSEALDTVRVKIVCQSCDHIIEETAHENEIDVLKNTVSIKECAKCSNVALSIVESKTLIEDLVELAEYAGTKVEIISTETEEGIGLWKAFKGIAGILRFQS